MSTKPSRTRLFAGALIGMVVATSLSLLGTAPASAAPPAPTNLQASSDPIPVLSWDRVDTATSYRVQGSETASFSSLVFNQSTTNVQYVPVRVLKEGTFYWRVQAVDGTGSSAFTETSTSISTRPAPTNITITPANPSPVITPPVEPPVISWHGVPGAISYDVEMDPEGDFVGGTVKTNIKTTSYVWPDPQGVGETGGVADFFVRVRAKFDNNLQTDWSDYVQYDVGQLPAVTYKGTCPAGVACAPEPGGPGIRPFVTLTDVVFDWDPVRGAKQYEIWVSQEETFSDGNTVDKRVISGTRYSPKTTYDNANYYWKVRAVNAAGQPQPWPANGSEVRRRWPPAPTLLYPPNSDTVRVGGDMFFQWTPVPQASRYELVVGTSPGLTTGTITCSTAQTTFTIGYLRDSCSPGPLRLSEGTTYYWKVRPVDDPKDVKGIYSPTWAVVFDSGAVQRVSPINGATVTDPSLQWSSLNTTKAYQNYRVTIWDKFGTTVEQTTTYAQSYTPTVQLDPDKSPYSWGVVGLGSNGHPSIMYGSGSFNYEKPTSVPTPLAAKPSVYGDSHGRFPSLSWNPITDADYYRLTVFNSSGAALASGTTDVLNTDLPHPSVTDWKTHFISHPGTYTYAVSAYDETESGTVFLGSTSFANRGTFTIEPLEEVTGQEIALDGLAVDADQTCALAIDYLDVPGTTCGPVPATPVFNWDPVPGAGGYKLFIFEESDFTTPVYDPEDLITENTRWTPDEAVEEQLAESTAGQAGAAYYWLVSPCVGIKPILECGVDPESTLDVATNAFKKQSPPVVLTSPANDATAADEITFSWEDYRTTNANFPSYPAGGTKSPQSGRTYRIQVSQSATITDGNAIDDQIVDQATYTVYDDLYPEGDLYWRVQAIDAAGNRLAFSETRKVTKATPTENLNPETTVANERAYVDTSDPVACRAGLPAEDAVLCNTFPSWSDVVDTGEFAFRWPTQTFDATWNIEVYKNNDTSGSAANRVFSLTGSKQSAAVPTVSLTPSSFDGSGDPVPSSAYRWRIRRTDAYGNPSSGWSDYGRFYVKKSSVTLVSPTNGSPQPPNGPLLSWQAFSSGGVQAHHYAVDIRNATTNASVGSISETSATAFAPTVSYSTGTYSWVVTAFDASNNALGTSPTGGSAWTFTIDTSIPLLTPTEIHAPDGAQVAKTLTSTAPTWGQSGVSNTYQWLRAGSTISGATGTTYTLTATDVGKAITLRVTGKKPGFTDTVSTSAPLTANPGDAVTPSSGPTLTGVAAARETLTATPGTWPAGTDISYQWFVDGLAVAKATAAKYVVRTRDAGLPVYARVTGSRSGYVPGEANTPTLTVAKLTTTTTAKLVATPISKRSRAKIEVTVDILDLGVPLGKVQVKDGKKVLATVTVKNDSGGELTIRLKKLLPGKHKLLVTYLGSTATDASKAKKLKLVVLKK